MPRATCRYPFEFKVFEWAFRFSQLLTGSTYCFLVLLGPDGVVRQVIFGDEPERFDHGRKESLVADGSAFIFYDPFDGPVYTWLEWREVSRGTLERITDQRFAPEDFVSRGESIDFPMSWGVMF